MGLEIPNVNPNLDLYENAKKCGEGKFYFNEETIRSYEPGSRIMTGYESGFWFKLSNLTPFLDKEKFMDLSEKLDLVVLRSSGWWLIWLTKILKFSNYSNINIL